MSEKKTGAHLKPSSGGRPFGFGRHPKTRNSSAAHGGMKSTAEEPKSASPSSGDVVSEASGVKPVPTEAELKEKRRRRRKKELRNFLLRSVLYLVVLYVLFSHIVGVMIMPGGDMSPRLEAGDLVIYYRLGREFHAQDVVVLEKTVDTDRAAAFGGAQAAAAFSGGSRTFMGRLADAFTAFDRGVKKLLHRPLPDEKGEQYVSRIVAGPGDTVEIGEGERLIINGNAVVETNIFYTTPEYEGFVEYPVSLGDREYFVLSDHRQGAADSRFFGPVSENEILGVVITVARRNNL